MYREGERISCIPGVSRPYWEAWQVCQNVHPRFPDNDIAEKWQTPLLKQVKFQCVNLGESNGAQILLITWISWSGSEGEKIGQFWRIMGPLMDIKVFNTNLIRFVLVFTILIWMASWWNHSSKFHKFTFLCSLFFHSWNPNERCIFYSLGIYVKPFPIRQ